MKMIGDEFHASCSNMHMCGLWIVCTCCIFTLSRKGWNSDLLIPFAFWLLGSRGPFFHLLFSLVFALPSFVFGFSLWVLKPFGPDALPAGYPPERLIT